MVEVYCLGFKIEFITITTKIIIKYPTRGQREVSSQPSRVQYSSCYLTTIKAGVIPAAALVYFLFGLNALEPTGQLRILSSKDIQVPQVHDDDAIPAPELHIIRGHSEGIPFPTGGP